MPRTQVALAAALLLAAFLATCATAARAHPDNNPQARRLLQAAPAAEDNGDWDWQVKDTNCLVTKPSTPCPDNLPLGGCCGPDCVCRGLNDSDKEYFCNDWEPACCARPAEGK